MRLAGLRIDVIPDILKNGFLVAQIFARLAVEFPKYSVFSNSEDKVLPAIVNKDALENDVEVEGLAGGM